MLLLAAGTIPCLAWVSPFDVLVDDTLSFSRQLEFLEPRIEAVKLLHLSELNPDSFAFFCCQARACSQLTQHEFLEIQVTEIIIFTFALHLPDLITDICTSCTVKFRRSDYITISSLSSFCSTASPYALSSFSAVFRFSSSRISSAHLLFWRKNRIIGKLVSPYFLLIIYNFKCLFCLSQ